MATKKKVTRVGGETVTPGPATEPKPFVPTPESKSKATRLRVIAGKDKVLPEAEESGIEGLEDVGEEVKEKVETLVE